MTSGQSFTIEVVRFSVLFYAVSVAAWLLHRDRVARATWTVAGCFYLAHVYGAFDFYHHWSHAAAYTATARQTADVFGINWGGGLYFNYAFTILWIADILWWWRGLVAYRKRPAWTSALIHWFFAFMFFNAAVVFAAGPTRWFGLTATFLLAALAVRTTAA